MDVDGSGSANASIEESDIGSVSSLGRSNLDYWQSYSDQCMQKVQKYTRNEKVDFPSKLDFSYNANLERSQSGMLIFEQSVLDDISVSLNHTEYSQFIKKSQYSKPESDTDFDSLYVTFCETSEMFHGREQIFDLISGFIQNCDDFIDILNSRTDFARNLSWLETERNTWKLLYALYRNRLVETMPDENLNVVNEADIIGNFFQTDTSVTESQLVIDWLEQNASQRSDHSGQLKLPHYIDKTVAWENTLYQLQNDNIAYSSTRLLVESLDPDAPLRTKKHIHDLDAEDEARLLDEVFIEIRCGRLEKAVEMCNLCGHFWRAAILEGWKLYNDPNYTTSSAENTLPSVGNPNRDIWKVCAWNLTISESSALWKAILGVFCGNLSAVLPICKRWEDFLWAYLKVLVDVRVENKLRTCNSKIYSDLPEEYWNFKFSLEEIFVQIAGSKETSIRMEASKPERLIQKCIILNEVSELLSTMATWCQKKDFNYHIVRFSAHLVLFLKLIPYEHNEQHANDILSAYVKILTKLGNPHLVAFYCSYLPSKDQISHYAEFLENIEDSDMRSKCIEAAENCNLEIDAITQHLVQTIRERKSVNNESVALNHKPDTIIDDDLKKISALDWIMNYPHQRGEALWQANALIRHFIMSDKLQAARLALNKIPSNSIKIILDLFGTDESVLKTNNRPLPLKFQAAIKEYLSYKAYLDAEEKFSDWFYNFHKGKPMEPKKLANDAQFTEKVAYEHHLSNYRAELERWKSSSAKHTEMVQSYLYNVLLFPDGGWLIDNEYTTDESRLIQLKHLRGLCIPKIVLLLHSVLHSTANYNECMKLSDVIVSETYKIYTVYTKEGLGELLKKICESSICLLNLNKDPWGHPVSS